MSLLKLQRWIQGLRQVCYVQRTCSRPTDANLDCYPFSSLLSKYLGGPIGSPCTNPLIGPQHTVPAFQLLDVVLCLWLPWLIISDKIAVLADSSNMKPSNRILVPEIQTLLVVSVCMRSGLAWLSACTKPLVLRQVVPSFPIHPLLFYHHKSHSNKTRKWFSAFQLY